MSIVYDDNSIVPRVDQGETVDGFSWPMISHNINIIS